jgi:hypothetical protein
MRKDFGIPDSLNRPRSTPPVNPQRLRHSQFGQFCPRKRGGRDTKKNAAKPPLKERQGTALAKLRTNSVTLS